MSKIYRVEYVDIRGQVSSVNTSEFPCIEISDGLIYCYNNKDYLKNHEACVIKATAFTALYREE